MLSPSSCAPLESLEADVSSFGRQEWDDTAMSCQGAAAARRPKRSGHSAWKSEVSMQR